MYILPPEYWGELAARADPEEQDRWLTQTGFLKPITRLSKHGCHWIHRTGPPEWNHSRNPPIRTYTACGVGEVLWRNGGLSEQLISSGPSSKKSFRESPFLLRASTGLSRKRGPSMSGCSLRTLWASPSTAW